VSASQLPCANVGINATTGLWCANECTLFPASLKYIKPTKNAM